MTMMTKRLRDEMNQDSQLEWLRMIEFHDRSIFDVYCWCRDHAGKCLGKVMIYGHHDTHIMESRFSISNLVLT